MIKDGSYYAYDLDEKTIWKHSPGNNYTRNYF